MGYKTTIQLLLIIVSIVIITTYIRPTFTEMQKTQDQTQIYQTALDNAAKFNQELQRLVSQAASFSAADMQALERYLPDEVDTVRVMRDIETITKNNEMILVAVTTEAAATKTKGRPAQGQPASQPSVSPQKFSVSVLGSYEQFKLLLQDFERNVYPLEIVSVGFAPAEDSNEYTFTIDLETYSLNTPQQ